MTAEHERQTEELTTVTRKTSVKLGLSLMATVLAAGFIAAMYLNRYAQASEVKELLIKHDAVDHRLTTVESTVEAIHEDFHWQREQIQKMADKVGAERVPPPKHHY